MTSVRDGAPSPEHRVFCSYTHRDRALVEPLVHKLRTSGLEVWFDDGDIGPGDRFLERMDRGLREAAAILICIGPGEMGRAAELEMEAAVIRQLDDPTFRIVPILLPGLPEALASSDLPSLSVARHSWVDFRDGIEDPIPLDHLARVLLGLDPSSDDAETDTIGVSPYRGLQPFEAAHSSFFFGRDDETANGLGKLRQFGFLAVLGPSGSGKSSLAVAGIAPRIAESVPEQAGVWHTTIMRPSRDPILELAAAIGRLPGAPAAREIAANLLDTDPAVHGRTLALMIGELLDAQPAPAGILLVVDQLEQAVTLCSDEAQRALLFDQLVAAAERDQSRFRLVVTLRADFFGESLGHSRLTNLIADHHLLVTPMDATRLRAVIEQPAKAAGLELQAGLVETILADVQGQPQALPLLEHALYETWQARRSRRLTLAGYLSSGGVRGAVAARAEDVVRSLEADDPAVVDAIRRLFTHLTRVGDGTEDTAQPQLMTGLVAGDDRDPIERLVDAFAADRLLTVRATLDGPKTVEVAHEALIRSWPRLRQWIDDDRAALLSRQRLADAARLWQGSGGDPSYLFRGSRLDEARAIQRDEGRLDPNETAFLEAAALAESAQVAQRARLRLARRSAIGLAVATALVATGLIVAVTQWRRASNAQTEARSYQLAAESQRSVGTKQDLALLLAVESVKTDTNPISRAALLDALAAPGVPSQFLPTGAERVGLAAINRDGVALVDRTGEREQLVLLTGERRDRRQVVDIVNVAALVLARESPVGLVGSDTSVLAIDLVSDRTRMLGSLPARVTAVALDPAGRFMAAGSETGTLRSWTAGGVSTAREVEFDQPIASLAVGPTGEILVGGGDGMVAMVPAGPDVPPVIFAPLSSDAVTSVAYDVTRNWAYTMAAGRIVVWDLITEQPLSEWIGLDDPIGSSLSPDGASLSAVVGSGGIATFDTATGREVHAVRKAEQPVGAAGTNRIAALEHRAEGVEAVTDDGRIVWWIDSPQRPIARSGVLGVNSTGRPDSEGEVASCTSASGLEVQLTAEGVFVTASPGAAPIQLEAPASDSVGCDSNGTRFAVGGEDVLLWDSPGASPRILVAHTAPVHSIAFSPDGRRVATGSDDRVVIEWDARSGDEVRRFTRQTDKITALVYSPDGHLLVSGSEDGTAVIWDLARGDALGAPLLVDGSSITGLDFEQADQLVTTTRSGTTLVWELSEDAWIDRACAVATRTFTVDEQRALGLTQPDPCR